MPNDSIATHSAVLPRPADACIARMMRKPNGATLDVRRRTALLSHDVALLVRHASDHADERDGTIASASCGPAAPSIANYAIAPARRANPMTDRSSTAW